MLDTPIRARYLARMSMRSLVVFVLALGSVACGSSSARPAASNGTTTTTTVSEPPATAAAAPCTVWDASGDRLAAPADVAQPPEHARRSLTGLRWCVLVPGDGGAHPTSEQSVLVHYTGWTSDGERFDSSRERGEPATFPVSGVISGFGEGLRLMSPGETRLFWIPESLAYGGRIGTPQGMLVFEVELISIVE